MSNYLSRTCSRSFERVIDDVTARLRSNGFIVVTDIDVQEAIRSNVGERVGRYHLLGTCNPRLTFEGLQCESKPGLLPACNVAVREIDGDRVEISSLDPIATLDRYNDPALGHVAQELRHRLLNVIVGAARPETGARDCARAPAEA